MAAPNNTPTSVDVPRICLCKVDLFKLPYQYAFNLDVLPQIIKTQIKAGDDDGQLINEKLSVHPSKALDDAVARAIGDSLNNYHVEVRRRTINLEAWYTVLTEALCQVEIQREVNYRILSRGTRPKVTKEKTTFIRDVADWIAETLHEAQHECSHEDANCLVHIRRELISGCDNRNNLRHFCNPDTNDICAFCSFIAMHNAGPSNSLRDHGIARVPMGPKRQSGFPNGVPPEALRTTQPKPTCLL